MRYDSLLDRIIANSVLSEDCEYKGEKCWEWVGGYRQHRSDKRGVINMWCPIKKKVIHVVAYRAAIMASGRRIGPNQVARHRCDNPLCVNPNHLFVGTQSQNMRECVSRGRHKSNHAS